MDKKEAKELLAGVLSKYRSKSYSELRSLVEDKFALQHTHYEEIDASSGNWYQVRVNVYWDDKKEGNLRVIGAIDDGGIRAFVPVTDSFILSPGGEFIGE